MKFDDFKLDQRLLKAVEKMGLISPTSIQTKAIPLILKQGDVIGCSQTGTGKTAGFLLPIFHQFLQNQGKVLRVLVLEPTRELTAQIGDHGQKMSRNTRLSIALLYGGVSISDQIYKLRRKPDMVVATPGRLLDHARRKTIQLKDFNILVVDEADRMLDMGFLPDVNQIVRQLPRKRQTLLFSATMPQSLQSFARQITHDPVIVRTDNAGTIPDQIEQSIFPVSHNKKLKLLEELLHKNHISSALIFCGTKRWADVVVEVLKRNGRKAEVIHGDRSQHQRERALKKFREKKVRILVASDVASRGLDIEAVSHVINFDAPATPDAYIQRVGRTGHSPDAKGRAMTFVTPHDQPFIWETEKKLGRSLKREMIQGFHDPELPAYFCKAGTNGKSSKSAPRRRKGSRFARRQRRPRLR